MRHTGNAASSSSTASKQHASRNLSYENLAGTMASRMTGLLHTADQQGPVPPFHVVILSQYGAMLFEGDVNKSGKVVQGEALRQVRRSHFPATVFFTDRSRITRTFQIVRAPSAQS